MQSFHPAEPAVIPVGEGAYRVLEPLMTKLNSQFGSEHRFVPVPNSFFGGKVNVTGLLTGSDILANVQEKKIILPDVVLNTDQLFLDDMSLAQFKERYPGKVEIAKGAKELLHLLLER